MCAAARNEQDYRAAKSLTPQIGTIERVSIPRELRKLIKSKVRTRSIPNRPVAAQCECDKLSLWLGTNVALRVHAIGLWRRNTNRWQEDE